MPEIWPTSTWWYWTLVPVAGFGIGVALFRAQAAGRVSLRAVILWIAAYAGAAWASGALPEIAFVANYDNHWARPSHIAAFVSGIIVVIIGLSVAAWAAAGDPANGRRRCPRCWFDMSATPGLTCSECGHAARGERRLLRTRRRKRHFAVAAAVVIGGLTLVSMDSFRTGRWADRVPEVIVMAGMPWWPDGGRLQEQFWYVLHYSENDWSKGWRHAFARNRVRSSLRRDDRPMLLAYALASLDFMEVDEAIERRCVQLLEHPHAQVRVQALHCVSMLYFRRPEEVLPHIEAALADANVSVVHAALHAIRVMGWQADEGLPLSDRHLALASEPGAGQLKLDAIHALGAASLTEDAIALLLRLVEDPEEDVRASALAALSRRDPDRARAAAARLHALDDPSTRVRIAALREIASEGPYTQEALLAIGELDALGEDAQWHALEILAGVSLAPIPLADRLDVIRRVGRSPNLRGAAIAAVTHLRYDLPAALKIVNDMEAEALRTGDFPSGAWCRGFRHAAESILPDRNTTDTPRETPAAR